jgi:hypothetical protein
MLKEIGTLSQSPETVSENGTSAIAAAVRKITNGRTTSKFLDEFCELRSRIPFLTYALNHWVGYIKDLGDLSEPVKGILLKLFDPGSLCLMTVVAMYKADERHIWPIPRESRWSLFRDDRFLGLHVAVLFGFEDVIRHLCQADKSLLLETDSAGRTALHFSRNLKTTRFVLDMDPELRSLEASCQSEQPRRCPTFNARVVATWGFPKRGKQQRSYSITSCYNRSISCFQVARASNAWGES